MPGGVVLFSNGHVHDDGGYSVAFSWWRNSRDFRFWSFTGHERDGGFTAEGGRAVVDCFGSLVAVSGGVH